MVPAMASRRAVLVLLVAVAASSVDVALGQAPAGPDYSYVPGTKLGPENWAKLSPAYSACNGGAPVRKQSPIDIVTKNAVSRPDLETLNRTYAATDATLINNGKEISASPPFISHPIPFLDLDSRGARAFHVLIGKWQCR